MVNLTLSTGHTLVLGKGHEFAHVRVALRLGGMAAAHCESFYLKIKVPAPLLICFQVTPLGPVSERQLLLFVLLFDNGVIELLGSILSNLDPSVYQESSISQQIIRKPYIFNPKPGSKYYLMLDDSAGTSGFHGALVPSLKASLVTEK